MLNYWWIPFICLSAGLAGYFSHKANLSGENHWVVYLWLLNVVPLWAVIAKYSKNILTDGLIYDILLTVVYTATVMYMVNKTVSFNWIQICCVLIMILALIVFKIAG